MPANAARALGYTFDIDMDLRPPCWVPGLDSETWKRPKFRSLVCESAPPARNLLQLNPDMCGRYYRRSEKQKIAEAFHTGVPTSFEILPSYNVAPQTFQPVVALNRQTLGREIIEMRWGLVPYWATDPKIAYSTINAKAETLATSPVFREAFKRRRCLIPADGFYEWEPIGKKTKQPSAFALKDHSLFALAGVFDVWKDKKTGQALISYSVITTDPNELLEPFHNRMPVILKPADYERWIAPADPHQLPIDLLRPFPDELMTAWKISPAVGNVKNDTPDLIAPIQDDPLQARLSL